ncbi:MAG TPA: hypothetical protein VFC51_18645 [Chloroflexota bacterium]|nr:hypothetical protein [Chloroflexota bacterium]
MDPANELADYLEAAVIIRDRKLAAAFAGLLGDLTAVHRQISVSNVARPLGEAAALTGDLATARRHYDRSLTWATQIRHRPEIALTRLALAELLLEGSSDERAEAKSHLDFAIEEFRAMKMQPSLERALRHKGLLHA